MDDMIAAIDKALAERGMSASAASLNAVGNPSVIKNLRKRRGTSRNHPIENLRLIADYLDLELYLGPRRETSSPLNAFSANTLPHHGFAKCSVRGWGKDQPDLAPLPRPEFINDPDAFYVSATGQSMEQEGIRSGDFCLISPVQDIKEGDRIWLKDRNGLTSIKRLEKMTGETLTLRGWMPIKDGQQTSFNDEVATGFVRQAYPVVAVFRGKPGTQHATFIPDPMGDEPQLVTGLDVEEFATIRLHNIQLSAGVARQSWDDGPATAIAFPKAWLRQQNISPSAASLVWISGDSMEPTLSSGAVVMINHNRRDPTGRRIYAFRQGDDLRVKRLEILGGTQMLITSDNPAHQTELVSERDMGDFEVIGEVVWCGATVG